MMLVVDCLCLLRSKIRFMASERLMYTCPQTIHNESEMLLDSINLLTVLNSAVDFDIVLIDRYYC
jgi:hypothetical protein